MRRLRSLLVSLALAGCATHACPNALPAPARSPSFVVVRSDYASSALAVLDDTGAVIDADWIDSGTCVSTLTTGLGSDVVLPQAGLGGGGIAWIDRLNVDVLSMWSPSGITQVDLRGETLDTPHTGFTANPQDALRLPDGRILVARLGANPDASAPMLQRGNDVAVVEGGRITASIDLHADGPCVSGSCTAYAQPSALARVENGAASAVVVALTRCNRDFDGCADGAVAVIAPDLGTSVVPIAGLQNCLGVLAAPGEPRAYVLCAGTPRSPEDVRRATAGIVELSLEADGTVHETARYAASNGGPIPRTGLVPIGGRRVLFVESPTNDVTLPDHLQLLDVAVNATREIARSSDGFTLLAGTLAGHVALIPDWHGRAIRRFDVSADFAELPAVHFDDGIPLGPTVIAPL